MKTYSIAAPTSTTTGAATEIPSHQRDGDFTAWITGITTATYQLQISPDLTNWFNEGDPVTADGAVEVTKHCRGVRWDCTAFTAATPVSVAIFNG